MIHPSLLQDNLYTSPSSRISRSSPATATIAPNSSPEFRTHTGNIVPMRLTHNNLVKHHIDSVYLWDDPAVSQQIRQDHSEQLRVAIRDLGIELPERMVNEMATSYDGMTAMERYLAETNRPLGEQENIERHAHVSKQTVAADASWKAGVASSGNGKRDRYLTV